ncbi:hypothetical protein KIN20_037133 [Parelaphostrongylus tenuis]|uniref:Uncharacterized protein n=1 Tax=Parelaphostrongylus tenuis TaxID=148309 RepID=A0AAD5RE49_PARTN|nr:hypothetical protein KIN20_037133 [Parelaphostrongylus tenuis]
MNRFVAIGLDQQHNASSQQNICSSVHSIPCKDPSNSLRESAANLYNSGGESDHQRNASSQQNIGSSVHSIACKGPLSSLRQSAVDLPSTNLEPGLETHARSEQNICLSVDSTACHDSQNSVKSFTLSRRPSYLRENKNVKAPPPSPVVGHSFGTAPDSISRPPSRISLHGFETNNGGLWYHFSDSERSRDSASNKLTLSQTPTKSAKSSLKARAKSIVFPKVFQLRLPTTGDFTITWIHYMLFVYYSLKPLRSRSSTTSVRNEVNFASIPQLYSHPNDRFDVDSGGEPFRPTSEHKFTPHVPKSESRLRLLSETTNVDGNKAPHTNSVDVDTQLLSVPIESNSGEKCGNTFVQQSETPLVRGLEIVPPALFVTDALTPNRAVSDLDDNCDFNSPASFNRTHFSREMYQRRWITEPHQCEVGIQTGETIRLRQKMFDSEEQPCGPDKVVEQGAKPDQPRGSPSYRQFASSPFEKRGHPAPVVLNTMLQNRQRLMERNTSEDFRVLEKTSPLAYRTDHKTEVEQQQHHVQKRQPPVDNYHQYETRTHQKWTSNTRSHWEGRKLDENFNELRSDNRNEMEKHCGTGGPTGVPESGEQYSGSSHRVEVSEKPFEGRETIVERCERYEEKTVHLDSTVHHWKRNILSEQQMDATRKFGKSSHKVDGTSGATGSDQPIVIPKEAVKQLRQEVMDESRQPATPKTSRVRCFNIQQTSTGQEKPLAAPQIKTFSLSSNNEVLSPTSQYRISIKHALSPFGPTSQKHEAYGFNNEGSDQTSYKWKVADIDTKKQYKEPDARSSDARSGRSGSTVRRHIPRGRIRDLAALFNKMSREAERETTTARGKSLPPPKKHSKIVRTNSVRRPPDSPVRINILNEESERLLGQLESREPSMKELPSAAQDIVNENLMSNSPCHLVSSEKDNYRDTQAPPFHPLNWANLQPAGGEVVVVANEEVESTDSRIELRRTSTPLENRGNGDLANVFCGVPSIPSPNNSATIATKCPRSEFNGNFHYSEQNRREDIHTQKLMNSILHETDGHCGQTVEVKASPPPQRLSLMHPNSSQKDYYSQYKQPSNGQQYRSVESCPPPSTCARTCAPHLPNTEQERVDGEIDRMFEFVDEHDGISTIGRESLSERKISVLKHDEYGSVQGDGVGHLPELPPRPPQPPMSYSIYSPKQPGYNSAFKYSMSQYRDVQRSQHMGRTSVDLPARFSSPTAPTAGIGVSTYKSREGTIGEKVNIFNNVSRSPYTHPSALATSTPVDSPQGTACSQQGEFF